MSSNPSPVVNKPEKPQEPGFDAGHIPMTEELDSARWSLPPVVPVIIAAAVIAVLLAFYLVGSRKPPTSSGSVSRVIALPMHIESKGSIAPGMAGTVDQDVEKSDSIIVAIALDVKNAIQKPMYIKGLEAKLVTKKGELTDDAAPASDYERIVQAYPQLNMGTIKPFQSESSIAANTDQQGLMVVSFPISRDDWESRKSLTATVNFYDHAPLVLNATKAASAADATLPTKIVK
jgi:hypothetical protein